MITPMDPDDATDPDREVLDDGSDVVHFHRLRRFVRPSEQKSISPVLGITLVAMLLGPQRNDRRTRPRTRER